MKFYLFKFHHVFDGLIGIDNLKKLQANLDYDQGYLLTPYARIPLEYYKTKAQLNFITISPRTEQVIKIKTNVKQGDVVIPYTKINDCEIPNSLSTARDGEAITTITNNSCEPFILDVSKPIEVEQFKDLVELEINHMSISTKRKDIPISSQIRTEHLDWEEKRRIIELCEEFADIFYREGEPLTFTSKIKHEIKTKDEQPVYAKTYRYPFVHKQEVKTQIDKMLEQNIIRPSNSPWSAPLWVVPKKMDASGKQKWRVCVDFRKLNEKP